MVGMVSTNIDDPSQPEAPEGANTPNIGSRENLPQAPVFNPKKSRAKTPNLDSVRAAHQVWLTSGQDLTRGRHSSSVKASTLEPPSHRRD
jgi:hypothetical protein